MRTRKKRKSVGPESVSIVQSLWVDTLTLTLDKRACISCDLCRLVCPKEAVSMVADRVRQFPDIDEEKCSLCGLCVTFCPVNAVSMISCNTWKGTEEAVRPILDAGGVPQFSKGTELDTSLCPPGCDLCVQACPREALTWSEAGVTVDRLRCLSCAHCEAACPVEGAIKVTRLFDGNVEVELEKCPQGCDLCVEACPTRCYTALPRRGVSVDSMHCICCGACLVACPHGAIDLTRLRLRSQGDGYSAVWSRAVERLLSENALFLAHNERSIARLVEMLRGSRL